MENTTKLFLVQTLILKTVFVFLGSDEIITLHYSRIVQELLEHKILHLLSFGRIVLLFPLFFCFLLFLIFSLVWLQIRGFFSAFLFYMDGLSKLVLQKVLQNGPKNNEQWLCSCSTACRVVIMFRLLFD